MSTTPDISTDPQLSREEALAILNTRMENFRTHRPCRSPGAESIKETM